MPGLLPYDRQYQGLADPISFRLEVKGYYATLLYAWSEPKRLRIDPKRAIALIASGLFAPVLTPNQSVGNLESKWHYAWSEPVRVKRRLHPALNPFVTYTNLTPIPPATLTLYRPFLEPVWPKKGLGIRLQQTLAWPPRLLPPVNVTVTMSAFETGHDTFNGAITAANAAASARVSVREIPAISGAAASLEET